MKKMMTVFAVLTISSTVFASSKDLKTMNTLLKSGATSEEFMSQAHVGLNQVECTYSTLSKTYACNMTDILANDENGASLVLSGKNAMSVYNILVEAGAPADSGMGKNYVSAKSIRCNQAIKGVADGSAAQRTKCTIDLSAE